jgi:hypothetical protein
LDLAIVLVLALGVPVLVLGVVLAVASQRLRPLQQARQQAITALCAQRGLLPSVAPGAFAMLEPIERQGLVKPFSSPDGQVGAADLVRSAGKNVALFSVLAFTVAGLNVPSVSVTRRNLLGTAVVGGPPILEMESDEFDKRFTVRAKDRRSAVMLLDQGMMQWLIDCDQVSFVMVGDRVLASVNREAEPTHRPTEPVEFEMLFKFWDGFVQRVPALLRSEYAVAN